MPQRDHLIFVNYRGSDEIWATEYVYEKMKEAFGEESVFKAGNALAPGDVYSPILLQKAKSCPVMLACIGPSWLTAAGLDGRRRLEVEDDWVRREIVESLQNRNRVIPLLLGDQQKVAMPKAAELPPDVSALFGNQAWRLTPGGGLDLTVPRLIDRLAQVVPELGARREEMRTGGGKLAAAPTPPAAPRARGAGAFAGAHFEQVGNVVETMHIHGGQTINFSGPSGEPR